MRRTNNILAIILVAVLGAACGGLQEGSTSQPRGATGKADTSGSCKGFCGTQSADGCYCDSECAAYGDCCDDKAKECDGAPPPQPGCSASGPIDALCGTLCATGYQVIDGQVMCTCCDEQFCGGIGGLPCPAGFYCKADGNYPDAGGKCVVKNQCFGAWLDQAGNCRGPADGVLPDHCCGGMFCGGIAGIKCPTGYQCKLDGSYPDAGGKCIKCQPVLCELYCANGFDTDDNGCEVCKCKAPDRTVASGACVKNSFDSCNTDADCVAGGCGGELCYNPAFNGGVSTCECVQPTGVSCGCVNNKCAWWN